MAKYKATSPWYNTTQNDLYLEIWRPRPVPADPDDYTYEIAPQYNYRPDLLANDLYGSPRLWWVFAQRNADVLFDPIYDFKVGTIIKLPKKTLLLKALGL